MKAKLYPAAPILLVDDEMQWLNCFAMILNCHVGINNTIQCDDSRKVLDILDDQSISLVVLDLTMPYISGDELLPKLVEAHPEVPVIVLSGQNQLEAAVRCMKLGACDYFVKTAEVERLVAGVRRALEMAELRRENRALGAGLLDRDLEQPEEFEGIISQSPQMTRIFKFLEAIAPSSEPLLITGESGTGKELIARTFHRLCRAEEPFVAVNAAGLDDNVFADTLFGHIRGAFTGAEGARAGMLELAASGVLFLDEIGDLSLVSQVKLLRLLQEQEYFPLGSDVARRTKARFAFATNCDLAELRESGRFRNDLYYRLCAHHVHLPPLRERPEDIPLLVDHFLQEASGTFKQPPAKVPRQILSLLQSYQFPGNLRELRALIYNAVSLSIEGELALSPFQDAIAGLSPSQGEPGGHAEAEFSRLVALLSGLPELKKAGDYLVADAMRRTRQNQSAAARMLGISQPALHRRINKKRP